MKCRSIDLLAKSIMRLPGIGPRSARKAAFFLINNRDTALRNMISAMQSTYENIKLCRVCGNFDEINPCSLCNAEAKDNILCLIKDHSDLYAVQSTKIYNGRYHILGASFSPSSNDAKEIMEKIKHRISKEKFDEVILALHPSVEGRMLSHYIAISLEGLCGKITHLGLGIPIGADFEYLDSETISAAIMSRTKV